MARLRQGLKLSYAKNKTATYKVKSIKYYYKKITSRTTAKYSYKKYIIAKKKKYSYKRG